MASVTFHSGTFINPDLTRKHQNMPCLVEVNNYIIKFIYRRCSFGLYSARTIESNSEKSKTCALREVIRSLSIVTRHLYPELWNDVDCILSGPM